MSTKDWPYECDYCDNPLTPGNSILVIKEVMVSPNGVTYMKPGNKILRFCSQACVDDYIFSPAFPVTRTT